MLIGKPLTIGLLGCGVVGGGVAQRILHPEGLRIAGRTVTLAHALVRDVKKPRTPESVLAYLTADPAVVLDDPAIDVIVECVGGVHPAADYVETALRRGRHVVTANKALLAERGAHLESVAARNGVTLAYEASVGGATPVIRTLRHLAATDQILEVGGVLNGTTNYVLNAMEDGLSMSDAVARAQANGFAERDPSTDLEGIDAAHKLTVLAAIAYGTWPAWTSIARRGITGIDAADIASARARGGRLKLTAWARRGPDGIDAVVGPTFVPSEHPFAGPRGAENVVLIVTRHAGPVIVGGVGAGGSATASAIIGDLSDIVRGAYAAQFPPAGDRIPSGERGLPLTATVEKESTHA